MTDTEKLEAIKNRVEQWAKENTMGLYLSVSAMQDIEGIIKPVPSIPTHYGNSVAGDKVEAWDLVEGVIGRCTCDVAYVSRQMTDPNCRWCDYHVDLIEAINRHAANQVEKEKESFEDNFIDSLLHELRTEYYIDTSNWDGDTGSVSSLAQCIAIDRDEFSEIQVEKAVRQTEIGASAMVNMKQAHIEAYQRELSAANQTIAELKEQNKKYLFMIEHGLGMEDMKPPQYPHP